MADDKQKIDTPSSFWGIGGMALTLLSLATMLLMVFAGGVVIGGLIVGLLGMTAGLVCMGVGVYKNNSVIKDICKENDSKIKEKGTKKDIWNSVGEEQTEEKIEQKSKNNNNEIDSDKAKNSKQSIDAIKSDLVIK